MAKKINNPRGKGGASTSARKGMTPTATTSKQESSGFRTGVPTVLDVRKLASEEVNQRAIYLVDFVIATAKTESQTQGVYCYGNHDRGVDRAVKKVLGSDKKPTKVTVIFRGDSNYLTQAKSYPIEKYEIIQTIKKPKTNGKSTRS